MFHDFLDIGLDSPDFKVNQCIYIYKYLEFARLLMKQGHIKVTIVSEEIFEKFHFEKKNNVMLKMGRTKILG